VVIGLFASVAIALAGIGTFGIVSHSGARRSREIALRMALGANRNGVLKLVMGQGMVLVLIGVAAGLILAFAVTRLLTTFLFEVSATDATTFLAASLVVGGIGLTATFFPAWKTTCVDPMTTLRAE
jgi:putative ABC transport system permease protein